METQKQEIKKKTAPPAVKATNAVAVAEDFNDYADEVVDTKDIIVPKILLMHPTSDLVKKGERSQGDIIKSTSADIVAKRNEKFEVLVFEKWKEWRIMKKNPQSGRFEYVRLEKWSAENDELPWDYEENGESFRRDKTMNFYGILASDVAKGTPFPVKLSFVRTGFKTGLKIADAYARALMEKDVPTRQVFSVGSELVNGKEETYFAFTAQAGRTTTPEERSAAQTWKKVVKLAKQNNTIQDDEKVDDLPQTSNTTSEEF